MNCVLSSNLQRHGGIEVVIVSDRAVIESDRSMLSIVKNRASEDRIREDRIEMIASREGGNMRTRLTVDERLVAFSLPLPYCCPELRDSRQMNSTGLARLLCLLTYGCQRG